MHVVLSFDPEGSAYCVLSTQDADDIADIIAREARAIWESSEAPAHEPARVEGDIRQSCRLWTRPGSLQAVAHDAKPLIALAFDSDFDCKLNATDGVALVQILQHMSDAIVKRTSTTSD